MDTTQPHAAATSAATPPALESALQLQLWLAATLVALPDTALAGLGLSKAALHKELEPYRADVDSYRKLQATARMMSRSQTAELLRCRVNCMALAARTPTEMAAVARTVRTLPDWVWEDVVQDADAATAPSRERSSASPGAGWGTTLPSAAMIDSALGQPLNRAERRRLEALQRKKA